VNDQNKSAIADTIWAVRGSLGVFNLVDLIQLLAQNKSRGCLVVHHPDRGEGRFYMEDGKLVHASFSGFEDLEALQSVLHDERGSFQFSPGLGVPKHSIKANLDNLLLAAVRGLEEAPRLEEKQTPRPDEVDVPRVLDRNRLASITLAGEEFSVVERVDGQRSVLEIAEAAGLPFGHVQKVLSRLSALGLIEVRRRSARVARLVIGLSHDLLGLEVAVDHTIMQNWEKSQGKRIRQIRIREESGREFIFPAFAAPNLGAYLLLSSNALMRFELRAGTNVLAKPET
jgi:hypothetical protein